MKNQNKGRHCPVASLKRLEGPHFAARLSSLHEPEAVKKVPAGQLTNGRTGGRVPPEPEPDLESLKI